jgi:DNA-binding transcriptional LysR family regulator
MLYEILDELSTFVNLIKTNSSHQLSQKENITVSTIWRHVTTIENYFKTKLINRDSKNGIELTSDGLFVYNSLYLNDTKLNNHFSGDKKINSKITIYILTSVALSQILINQYLMSLNIDEEKYNIKIITFTATALSIFFTAPNNNLLAYFVKGCDIIFVKHSSFAPLLSDIDWKHIQLDTIKSYLYCSNDYLMNSPTALNSPQDVNNHHYIGEYNQYDLMLYSGKTKEKLTINPRYYSNSIYISMVMVANNLGISHLPEKLVELKINTISKRFVKILPEYHVEESNLNIYINRNSSLETSGYIDEIVTKIFSN